MLLVAARQLEFESARAEIVVTFRAFGTDVADKTCEQGAMNVFVFCGRRIEMHALSGDQFSQLRMDVTPFTHARV